LPVVESVWSPKASGHGFFKGTSACLSALFAAGRYDELLALIDKARFKWWHDRRWGVKALSAMGKKAEAIRYAEESRGLNDPGWQIAQACEEIMLSSGLLDEAYRRYAIEANQGTTNLATFRAIAKKYPHKQPEEILRDLVASTPGAEGKWFAAAKDASLFDVAIELGTRSPTDPRTLTRAARDYAEKQPAFALAAGLAALRWISLGHGYEITGTDVLDTYSASHAGGGERRCSSPADQRADPGNDHQHPARQFVDEDHPRPSSGELKGPRFSQQPASVRTTPKLPHGVGGSPSGQFHCM